MKIHLNQLDIEFLPWRPEQGRVFDHAYAFDTETTLIDEARPWLTPAYVLGAACDGRRGWFVNRADAAAFLATHDGVPMIMHNAAFDLAVLDRLAPTFDVYRLVETDRAWDTMLLHRLYWIGQHGHPARGKGKATLEYCADHYLGVALPKDTIDSAGRPVRLSYAQWLNRPFEAIEPVYLEYLAQDAAITYRLYRCLRARLKSLLEAQRDAFGYVSPQWLREQKRHWGPQTHHIQLKSAIVLQAITANGLRIDKANQTRLASEVRASLEEHRQVLRGYGFLPGQKGSGKALQEILTRLERENPDVHFPRTPTGKYQSSRDALEELAGSEPFIDALLKYKTTEKLLSTYLDKMGGGKSALHPSFSPLVSTGRTSSYGEINAQNLPRDDRIRACFVPTPGHVFVDADYSTVELATLAQSVQSQLGIHSEMAAAINRGEDLHRLVAASFLHKPADSITKAERQKAKAINFGKPGGMGDNGLRAYAKTSYGVDMTDEEVQDLSAAWFDRFPEMEAYLDDDSDLGYELAVLLRLTSQKHFEHTGDRRFVDHPENEGREDEPNKFLGYMCIKALRYDEPCTQNGRPYSAAELDYFWTQLSSRLDAIPETHHAAIRNRKPSVELQRGVMRHLDKLPVFTLTGRLRANAGYCARHNTLFQGLAADGAKLGMWLVWRAGYRIANFIHDELLVEVPAGSRLRLHAENIRALMKRGMELVVPDVRVEVEYAVTDRWYKGGEIVLDEQGRLVPWRNEELATAC